MEDSWIGAHIRVTGRVQGVGYRYFAQERAVAHGLNGWVRNLPDGHVEIHVEGMRNAIEHFTQTLRQGPPLARVDRVKVDWETPAHQFATFEIR